MLTAFCVVLYLWSFHTQFLHTESQLICTQFHWFIPKLLESYLLGIKWLQVSTLSFNRKLKVHTHENTNLLNASKLTGGNKKWVIKLLLFLLNISFFFLFEKVVNHTGKYNRTCCNCFSSLENHSMYFCSRSLKKTSKLVVRLLRSMCKL